MGQRICAEAQECCGPWASHLTLEGKFDLGVDMALFGKEPLKKGVVGCGI